MKDPLPNPFTEAYVTHSVSERQFVRYFSDILVRPAKAVFQPGNVVVRGTQGSGKSMLLRLLDPEIRIAYADVAKEDGIPEKSVGTGYPLTPDLCDFVSTRVDLNKSGLLGIVNTLPLRPDFQQIQHLAICFGDFLNFWLLRGLLNSLEKMNERRDVFGIGADEASLNAFATTLAAQDCFFGGLPNVCSWSDLKTAVAARVVDYRAWANGNRKLPEHVTDTRTSIGEPLGRASDLLRAADVIGHNTAVFCVIDQIEALWMQDEHRREAGTRLRREIHEVLGNRDGRVSYRIGVRKYDWGGKSDLAMRDGRQLEEERDYLLIDIDDLLRRDEHAKNWSFRFLARDVFRRRITTAFPERTILPKDLNKCEEFFGPSSPTPQELIGAMIKNPDTRRNDLLKLDDSWPKEWVAAIHRTFDGEVDGLPMPPVEDATRDPLNALLLAAWGLQTGGGTKASGDQRRFRESPPSGKDDPPWNEAKRYWRKERYPQAALQLASRHRQRLLWWGEPKILSLSGGNILRFITFCRETWDYWQRLGDGDERRDRKVVAPLVEPWIQSRAAEEASRKIHDTLRTQPGSPAGDVRIRFLDEVAKWLRNKLLDDRPMSYPGRNGFSLRASQVEKDPEFRLLLLEAVGWGDLYERRHTSKSKDDEPRTKYYTNPALAPEYQLPENHTKEPLYLTESDLDDLLQIAIKAGAIRDAPTSPRRAVNSRVQDSPMQTSLFDKL
jgi:hypothetical protein